MSYLLFCGLIWIYVLWIFAKLFLFLNSLYGINNQIERVWLSGKCKNPPCVIVIASTMWVRCRVGRVDSFTDFWIPEENNLRASIKDILHKFLGIFDPLPLYLRIYTIGNPLKRRTTDQNSDGNIPTPAYYGRGEIKMDGRSRDLQKSLFQNGRLYFQIL